jgi:glycosyltransferase involved in cell wall biosynthesis
MRESQNAIKKVAIFSAFYPFRGGIAQFNAKLYRSLEKISIVQAFTFKKQYPDLLFPGKSQYVTDKDIADNIPAKRVVSTFNPLTYGSASRAIDSFKPDIFIANFWMSFFAIFLSRMARMQNRNVKRIALIHNLIPHEKRFFDRYLIMKMLRSYDAFVVLSDAVEKDLLAMRPDAKYLKMEHPWYDHFGEKLPKDEARTLLKVSKNKKTLLFFGLIRDYKGLDVLIKAFSKMDDSYQLIIAGEIYGSPEKYNQLIEMSGNKNIYLFNAYIPDDEVSLYFSSADICVLPYRSATQSGVTGTSFHFEVPVVATDVGGLRETLKDGQLGVIVEPEDPEALVKAIESMFVANRIESIQLQINNEKTSNSWDAFAVRLLEFASNV